MNARALRSTFLILALLLVCLAPLAHAAGAPAPPATPAATPSPPPQDTPQTMDLTGVWKFSLDREEQGVNLGWFKPDFDSNNWTTINVPGAWENYGFTTQNPKWNPDNGLHYNGYAWYRRSVTIPATWTNEPVRIYFGAIDDSNWVYVNGTLVGAQPEVDWTHPQVYIIPPSALRLGKPNVIAVRVLDRAGEGGLVKGPVDLRYGAIKPLGVTPEESPYVHIGPNGLEVRDEDGSRVQIGPNGVTVGDGRDSRAAEEQAADELRWQNQRREQQQRDLVTAIVVLLFFALIGALLFPLRLKVMAQALLVEPTRAAVTGVLGLLALPAALVVEIMVFALVSVVLAITIVGALAVPAVAIVYLAVLCAPVLMAWLGCLAICLALGQATLALFGRRDSSPVWGTLLGAALLSVGLTLIFEIAPVLGGLLLASLIIFGFGLALITGTGAHEGWHPRELRHWRRRFQRARPAASEEASSLPEESAAPDAPGETPAPEGEEPPPSA